MVISGGNFKPDTLKPKEVVSLLLDDDELEKKCKLFNCWHLEKKLIQILLQYECGHIIYISVRLRQEEKKQMERLAQERKRKPEMHGESKVSVKLYIIYSMLL